MEDNANKASSAIKFGWIKGVLVGIPSPSNERWGGGGWELLIRGVPSPSSKGGRDYLYSSGVYLAQVMKGGRGKYSSGEYLAQVMKGGGDFSSEVYLAQVVKGGGITHPECT